MPFQSPHDAKFFTPPNPTKALLPSLITNLCELLKIQKTRLETEIKAEFTFNK
jgi:hypothetical protein